MQNQKWFCIVFREIGYCHTTKKEVRIHPADTEWIRTFYIQLFAVDFTYHIE